MTGNNGRVASDEKLNGVGGWLLVYLLGSIVGFVLITVAFIAIDATPIGLFVGIVGIFTIWSVFQTGQSWVRPFHILVGAVWVVRAIAYQDWPGTVGPGIWIWYWVVSERVKYTYSKT